MKATDFECVLRWTMVGGYRITNKLGHDPLPIANNPTGGGPFPVGTIIQIVPTEAMVKRRVGFNAMTHDWEFFSLGVSSSGTTINMRGTTAVVKQSDVTPVEQKPALTYVDGAATLADVAQSLSTFGVSPRELASILQALRTAGALRAEVIVQ